MIASLDCISKLISYSFFAETEDYPPQLPSPPQSPHPSGPDASIHGSQTHLPQPSLVDLVAHTITTCHAENTPETVSLQIVKALLSLILSPTTLVHHSSLLKAIRTVYNVFLLSVDPVNQMVAQGGLTQMVHHIFTRCRVDGKTPLASATPEFHSPDGVSPARVSFSYGPAEQSRPNATRSNDSAAGSANDSSASLPIKHNTEDATPPQDVLVDGNPPQSQVNLNNIDVNWSLANLSITWHFVICSSKMLF
jgi:brefeldin A-inhibited guanine nucleotide-exchange protein